MPPHIPTFCQSLDDASSVAAAYQVGRTEAAAATALLKSVSSSTRTKLKDLVRRVSHNTPSKRVVDSDCMCNSAVFL